VRELSRSCVARTLIAGGCLWGLTGCAVVTVVGADGQQETRLVPFAAESVAVPSGSVRQVKSVTFGISSRAGEFDAGLRAEDVVVMPPGCHAVLIVRSDAQADVAAKLAQSVNESCVITR